MALTNDVLKWATILAITEPPQRCKPKEKPVPYLTFYSSDGEFTLSVLNQQKNWDGALEWSTDLETWTEWTGASALSSIDGYLYIRGIGNSVISGSGSSKSWGFNGSDIACIGNIETILDYQSVLDGNHPIMSNHCYRSLFQSSRTLTEASELVLPAESLTDWCYAGMFSDCEALVSPPKILAKTAAEYCCDSMFYRCTNLIVAPELPATTLAYGCYNGMFNSCTNLISAPKLPAITLSTMCYNGMFQACTSLAVLPKLPATALAPYCYRGMFRLCSSLKISENEVDSFIYDYRIPISGSGTALQDSLTDMFTNTGGPFTGTPALNTTYYTDHEPV